MSGAWLRQPLPVAARSARIVVRPGAVRACAYAASLLFSIGWTLALGKDVHWDAVNYHLYLGYAALNDRFGVDFFAAGTPAYLNPYAYVPLWLMARAGTAASSMAIVFASLHAVAFWLTYEIALAAGDRDDATTPLFAFAATLLAAANPVVLQWLGATAIDLSTAVLVLGGWLAVALAVRQRASSAIVIGGMLCGVATALKLSNAAFAVAAVPALLLYPGRPLERVRAIVLFCVACGVASFVVAFPWSSRLWHEFGNPVFPFFNQWFASPDFTAEPLRYERFGTSSWASFVTRAFEIAVPKAHVHTEPRAPDLRYAALIVAFLTAAGVALRDRLRRLDAKRAGRPDRVLFALGVGFAVAWCVWLASAGNGRYFVPMACIAAVLLALIAQRLYRTLGDWAAVALFALVVAQAVQIAFGSDWKREGHAWQGPWLEVDIPQRERETAHLYLSAAFLSGSALVPYLHPQAGMINVTGFYALGPGHPGGERAQALIARNAGRVRMLSPLPDGMSDAAEIRRFAAMHAGHFRRFGLRVDATDCSVLGIRGNLRGAVRREGERPRGEWIRFASCRLIEAPEDAQAYARDVAPVDALFDRIEDACPALFHPRRPVTQEYPFWVRLYNMGSEMQLWVEGGRVRYFSPRTMTEAVDVGSVEQWTLAPQPIDCTLGRPKR